MILAYIYIYIYVCMYVCMYVCVCVFIWFLVCFNSISAIVGHLCIRYILCKHILLITISNEPTFLLTVK